MRGDLPTRAGQSHNGERDMSASAFDIYKYLDTLRPAHIPTLRYFPDQEVLKKWRFGTGTIPDHLKSDFAMWLESATCRSDMIAENKRRLRATLWAEHYLRRMGHADYADSLAEFHRSEWRIGEPVPDERWERERIVSTVVDAMAKGAA